MTPGDFPRTEQWIVKGRVWMKGNKVGIRFISLTTGADWLFPIKSAPRYASPGQVFEVVVVSETSARVKSASYLRRDESPEIAEWTALDRAFEAEIGLEREARKGGMTNEMKESLAPIVSAMRKTNHTGKLALKVLVMEYLEAEGGRF